jgi:hypothetical protein
MSSGGNNDTWQAAGRRFVRLAIVVAGLLLIRIFVDQLPMFHHASPIAVSATMTPEQQQFLARIRVRQAQSGEAFPDDQLIGQPGYILPVSLANAAIDTLIFIALLLGAAELGRQLRAHARRLPEAGTMIFLLVLALVAAFAYGSYAGVILPLLGTDYGLYDWLFLVLALIPVLAAILIGYRKLDVMTDMVLHSARQAVGAVGVPPRTDQANCSSCGTALPSGARFCAGCGTPLSARDARPLFCTSCGARNDGSGGRCASCGALSGTPS